MKLDPLAQLEAPGIGGGARPFEREPRLQLHVAVAANQRLVHAHVEEQEKRLEPGIGVHRVGVAVIGPAEGLGLGRGDKRAQREKNANPPIEPPRHRRSPCAQGVFSGQLVPHVRRLCTAAHAL